MAQIGSIIDGKYEILTEIGRGGMSFVYLAMDKRLNKQWAIKEIRKTGRGRNDEIIVNSLLAEANLMKRLDHYALPRIVDMIDNGDTIYVVMDYIEGQSLDKIINEYGAQPEDLVVSWAKQLCDALSYLHSQKPPIIYRDMKPANVMLTPDGNVKIIDFGIAREYKEQNLADTTVLGTNGYAPPEQYNGQTEPRSDIYALGMTMHHLLTGVDPRSGATYAPVRQWNPDLSEGLEAIIDKCVQPAAENRYQNCAELLYDLEHPEGVTRDFKRKQKIKLGIFMAAAILFVLTLLAGIVCRYLSYSINVNSYDTYIESNSIEDFKKAIELNSSDPRAYDRILDIYEDNINARCGLDSEILFISDELTVFQALYNPGNKEVYSGDYEGFAELNYRIGKMCFTYYDRTLSGNENFSDRINKAYVYLNQNHTFMEAGYVKLSDGSMQMSEHYFQICDFCKKFIFNQTADAASADDFSVFFETLYGLLSEVESNTAATAYDRLELYNNIFMILYNCKDSMPSAGVDENEVLSLFDRVYDSAESIDASQRTLWTVLKREMENNYEVYREAIEIAYKPVGVRN